MPDPKPSVLCVDDESDVLLILKTALKDDYEVRTASNGPDALGMVEERKPDLIILDMMMPEMDGFEVMAELKAEPAFARIPVIFLTGISDRDKIRKALNMGTEFYMVKPFEVQDLMTKTALALKNAKTTTP